MGAPQYANPRANQAKGSDGKPIRVGDTVQCLSLYNGEKMNIVKVNAIVRQGYDGTILHCDSAPDPDFPCHKSHQAKFAYRVP